MSEAPDGFLSGTSSIKRWSRGRIWRPWRSEPEGTTTPEGITTPASWEILMTDMYKILHDEFISVNTLPVCVWSLREWCGPGSEPDVTHEGFGRSSQAHRAALVVSLSLSEGVTATFSSLSLKTATCPSEATEHSDDNSEDVSDTERYFSWTVSVWALFSCFTDFFLLTAISHSTVLNQLAYSS